MRDSDNGLSLLDAITLVSFLLGLANYGENIDQSTINRVINTAVEDIHSHLAIQDDKLSEILSRLGGETK